MESNQPGIDDSLEDPKRRQTEKAILVAVITVPILLGLIINGYGHRIINGFVGFFVGYQSWPTLSATYALTSATLLLSWRHPLLGKTWWKPSTVVLATLFIPTIVEAASDLWYDPTQKLSTWIWAHLVVVMQWGNVLGGSLMLFVLIRRATGIRLIHKSTKTIPPGKPLSIAELLGWITACAVMLAVIPMIAGATPWTYAGTSFAYHIHLALQVLITTISPLSVVVTAGWRWAIRIPVAIAAIYLLHLAEPLVYSVYYSVSLANLMIENWIRTAVYAAGATVFVVWAMEKSGYRYVRLRRRSSVGAESLEGA